MPLSGCPASCLLPAHPTGVVSLFVYCVEGMCVGFAFGGTAPFGFTLARCRRRPFAEYTLTTLPLSLPVAWWCLGGDSPLEIKAMQPAFEDWIGVEK